MSRTEIFSQCFLHLLGVSRTGRAAAFAAEPEPQPSTTDWRERRLDGLECLWASINVASWCDNGPIIVAVESMEQDWLSEKRKTP